MGVGLMLRGSGVRLCTRAAVPITIHEPGRLPIAARGPSYRRAYGHRLTMSFSWLVAPHTSALSIWHKSLQVVFVLCDQNDKDSSS